MKKVRPAMHLFHSLQQELHDFGVQIAADQNLGLGANKLHIMGRNNPLNVDCALRQGHPSKIRENARKSLWHRETHWPHVWISQERLDSSRLWHPDDPHGIDLAIRHRLVCGRARERQERGILIIYAAFAENLLSHVPCSASDRTNSDPFAFELRELIELFIR